MNVSLMLDAIVAQIKGILLSPSETFRASRDSPAEFVFSYFLALLVVDALLTSFISALGVGVMGSFLGSFPAYRSYLPVLVFAIVLFGGVVWALIISAWIHLWVYIAGGRRGFFMTVRAVLYGMTPGLLFGWIPVIGVFFSLWSLVLDILGIRELQELSTGRAILVVVIAILIPTVLVTLAAAWFFISSVATITPVTVPQGL
jgi:hypothetical protein